MLETKNDEVLVKTVKKNSKETIKASAPFSIKGMVCSADAGCRLDHGGIGIHGYVYDTALPIKGIGLNSIVTTTRGYKPKESAKSLWSQSLDEKETLKALHSSTPYQVMPEFYIDYYATLAAPTTNNRGEITAVQIAIQMALDHGVSLLQIYSDSEMTCKAMNGWLEKWEARNWTRADGMKVSNVDIWKETKRIYDSDIAGGLIINFDWVRGHNGDIGNERADLLATIGVFQARQGLVEIKQLRTPSEGYWRQVVDRHPLIASQKLYFNTAEGSNEPGVYYLGHHGKDDDLVGTRNSETSIAIVKLKEPIAIIEMMRNLQASHNSKSDILYQLYLDRIFHPDHYRHLSIYDRVVVEPPSGYRRDLNFMNGPALTREFKPAMLASRVVDAMTELDEKLTLFIKKDPSLKIIDLTDSIYDRQDKLLKKKETSITTETLQEYKLKKDIVVGELTLDVDIPHPLVNDELYHLKLSFGLDLLERNSLKRLEEKRPLIYLIIWKDSELIFRFATVIEADGDIGIWCAPFSNLRVIVPPRTQEQIQAAIVPKKAKKNKSTKEAQTI